MRLNELLNNYINQNNVSVKAAGSVETQQVSNQIAAQIKALAPGQILQGEVLETSQDMVKLLVNMNGENVALQARLEQNVTLSLGKSLLFQVKNNGATLSLSPLFENMGMEQNAAKALEIASLPVNEATMGMTAKLMQEGISIDRNTLQEVYHEAISNQNADLMDIIDLHKLGMPVTEENLNQIHSYKAMTHQLTGGIEQMSQELVQLVQDMAKNGQEKEITGFLKAILQPESEALKLQPGQNQTVDGKTIVTEESMKLMSDGTLEEGALQGTNTDHNTAQSIAQNDLINMSSEQLIKELFQQLEHVSKDTAAMSKLVQSEGFQKGISELLQKQLLLRPEAADKDGVQEIYQRLGKQLSVISEALSHVGQEQSALGKTVQDMSQNVQFLNQMNSMYAYIQLPLKLSESNAHGELYVYSNKKHLASKDGEVSALLHLDMEHLGPVDVYVKLKDSNVSTRFYLQDDEMLDFIYEHMELLTARLEKRGYQMTYHLTVKGEKELEENTTFQELIKENSNIPTLVNYSFDVRA